MYGDLFGCLYLSLKQILFGRLPKLMDYPLPKLSKYNQAQNFVSNKFKQKIFNNYVKSHRHSSIDIIGNVSLKVFLVEEEFKYGLS